VGYDATGQLLIVYRAFVKKKKKMRIKRISAQLFIDFKKAYDSVRREVLYNILIQFGIPMELARLIQMCLHETYSRAQTGKHLSDTFHITNGLKQGDASLPLLFNCAVEYAIRRVQVNQDGLKLNGTHQLWFMLMMLMCLEEVYRL
jgi:hypothetical protein